MKRTILSMALLAAVTTAAFALDNGPGGRIYTTKIGSDGIGLLSSLVIGPDWTITEGIGLQAKWQDYYSSSIYNATTHARTGISPEIMNPSGTGYASVTFGVYGTTPGTASTFDKLMIGKIQTSAAGKAAGGTDAVEIIGAGKSFVNRTTGSTVGPIAFYDRTGSYSGHAGSYHVNVYSGTTSSDWEVWDAAGTSDPTDDLADYHLNVSWPTSAPDKSFDMEILNNKLLTSCSYYSSGGKGFWYYQKNDTGTGLVAKSWYMDAAPAGSPTGTFKFYGGLFFFASGMITGDDGLQHESVWALTYDSASTTNKYNISQFVDLNNNGHAMDAGEYRTIYQNTTTSVSSDDLTNSVGDIELIKGSDGKMFLMFVNNSKIEIIQLSADGKFQGDNPAAGKVANDYVKVMSVAANGLATMNTSFEFDAVVPEPASMTLLLIGGVSALLRRRNS